MKQIIFLCLLSLTLCLAKPTDQGPAAHDVAVTPATGATVAAQTPITNQTQTAPKLNTTETTPAVNATNVPVPAQTADSQKPNVTAVDSNKTVEKPTTLQPHVAETSTDAANKTMIAQPTTGNATSNATHEEKSASAKNATTPVTEAPKKPDDPSKAPVTPKSDEVKHIVQEKGFNGPSFIGGMILTLGLLAIGFMGYKYYKNQTERNYHTL